MSSDIPEIDVKPARRAFRERASIVWLVPIVGLLVALGVAAQTYSSRGPLLTLTFDEALGVKARETELRYRDVTVGRVEDVRFADDLDRVEVAVRVDKDIAPFMDADAAFWVVRPEVSAQGVTGLDTVLSGVFIEGVWDTRAEGFAARQDGLNRAPLLRPGEEGTILSLRAQNGSALSEGTAITYKGIEVGRVGRPTIPEGRTTAVAEAVILAPHDRLLSSTTRFWDTSGFSFSVGPGGANIDFASLSSLVSGGIAFDTLVSGGTRPGRDLSFDVFPSETAARDALFEEQRGNSVSVSMVFEENATGLSVGAPVQFNGIAVGEVTEIVGIVDPLRFRDTQVRLQVIAEVSSAPLGLPETADDATLLDLLAEQVEAGLRARLATASILTGGLRVELIGVPDAPPDALDLTADPVPALPTTDSDIADAGATAQGVLERINNLPVERLMASAIDLMDAATVLVSDGELAQIPADVRAILADVERLSGSQAVQAAPEQVAAILQNTRELSEGLATVVAAVEAAETIAQVTAALDAAAAAAVAVEDGVAGLPELIDSLTRTARTAETLPLDDLVAQVSGIVATAEGLLSAQGTQDLPATLTDTLSELQGALADLRAGGAVDNLNAALASAQGASDAIAQSAEALPEVVARLDSVLSAAEDTLQGYDENSDLNRAVRQALSDVAQAARAVESLSRTIERQPNSLILGR